jgi:type II secretory pathway predicted ATPase ExeA
MRDNLQNCTGRLLQTILFGSPELHWRLESEELCQFRERIAVRCCLHRPSEEETGQWMR